MLLGNQKGFWYLVPEPACSTYLVFYRFESWIEPYLLGPGFCYWTVTREHHISQNRVNLIRRGIALQIISAYIGLLDYLTGEYEIGNPEPLLVSQSDPLIAFHQ